MKFFQSSRLLIASVPVVLSSLSWNDVAPAIASPRLTFTPVANNSSGFDWSFKPAPKPVLAPNYIWPAAGTVTSEFGPRWGRMHQGLDIAGPVGTPIVAAADGVVISSGWTDGGYGNLVKIQHPSGSVTFYGHNQSLLVKKGESVKQGQAIAKMGSTGRSTGPHLHFEIRLPKQGPVNPVAYLPKFFVSRSHQ
jgi:murein DD-endopeptidase MepM/ murein hydrolase activator NlpD